MGSWSVYCGLSNLAITSGQECVFLPLKKNNRGYLPYIPATLSYSPNIGSVAGI